MGFLDYLGSVHPAGPPAAQLTQIVVTCRTRVRGDDWRLAVADGWQQRTIQPCTGEQIGLMLCMTRCCERGAVAWLSRS
jgi:hypothetical protein